MRLAVPLLALILPALGAAAAAPAPDRNRALLSPREVVGEPFAECRDRIHQVRAERGLPSLQRETASPGEPLLIAAVDRRVDGCSVLVMRQDASDIRPLPPLPDGPARLIPAH